MLKSKVVLQDRNGVELNMPEKGRLLIIDDDENTLETLGDVLQEKGYHVEKAKTGAEAIVKAEECFFNIALIDIKLPDMTGIEVLRTFRKKYPSRMNIIITAYATLQNTMDALNIGANTYVMKPVDIEKLDQIIKKCLKKQQEVLKLTEEKLMDFTEEVLAVKWQERRQDWDSREVKPKKA